MAQAIGCNYSRTALRVLSQREHGIAKCSSRASIAIVVEAYNKHFSEQGQCMHLSLDVAYKRVPQLFASFNKKWHPQSLLKTYLSVFSLEAWASLPLSEKNQHTLRNCAACSSKHLSLTRAFPCGRKASEKLPEIKFDEQDLSSPSNFGKTALAKLNDICEKKFKMSIQGVLSETPRSKLIIKPSGQEKQSEKRRVVRSVKKAIQQSMDETSASTVMSNRMSWRKFDDIRKSSTLESSSPLNKTPSRKRNHPTDENTPPTKRKHGSPTDLVKLDAVYTEAQTWSTDEIVNWSQLARRHGITSRNGGQTVKEFLRERGIAVALKESEGRPARRKRKTLPEGIPFPMERPSSFFKKLINEQVQSGEMVNGTPVVPTTVTSFTFDKANSEVVETTSTAFARKIPLLNIRKKLLQQHEKLDIIRSLTPEGEQTVATRHLKIWHDHSAIAGHGHFLVLVSVIYNHFFYLTQEEADAKFGKGKIDIQSTVEAPELHILGRSSSSIDDQALFSSCRNECLGTLSMPLCMDNGVQVLDIVRFFHGDGPAQQFEAGNSIGGNFPCVACGVRNERIADIAHAYRCQILDLQQRQDFLLQGMVWKNIHTRALDKLLLSDLKMELSMRGLSITGKKKPDLERDFENIRLGITNFPALLQDQPQASLQSLNLQQYEVSPTEPLHDLKGHLSNIIDETIHLTTGDVLQEIKCIKAAVLNKDTIRCSDLRKALILIYLKLRSLQPDSIVTDLYRTAVEISYLCYAHDSIRTPKSVLCLYNRAFLHAYQCSVVFAVTKCISQKRMFGRYFHSLTAHAATMFRIVSLRSLNTEQHERIFQQLKGITKGTSNNHPDHIITNIIQRLAYEEGSEKVIACQESQIKSISSAVGPMQNTIFPHSMMQNVSGHYQAHLERIGDYLVPGPGVWWKKVDHGIMFLDGSNEDDFKDAGPVLHHFKSMSLNNIDAYLKQQWEICCTSNVELPAIHLRYYGQDGNLERISNDQCAVEDCSLPINTANVNTDDPVADSNSINTSSIALVLDSNSINVSSVAPVTDSNPTNVSSVALVSEPNPINWSSVSHTNVNSVANPSAKTNSKPSYNTPYRYKTTLAKHLCNILQGSEDLQVFDKLRHGLKGKNSKISKARYIKLNEHFENKVFQIYKSSDNCKTRGLCRKLLVHEWGHHL